MSEITTDSLRALAQSTVDLYQRFNHSVTIGEAIQIFQEEVAELIEAAETGMDLLHTSEEAVDVMVTAIGICYAAGLDLERMVDQVHVVISKNNAKTHLTHEVRDGKIRRRTNSSN